MDTTVTKFLSLVFTKFWDFFFRVSEEIWVFFFLCPLYLRRFAIIKSEKPSEFVAIDKLVSILKFRFSLTAGNSESIL
jgi:hypothetical protein